MARRSSIAHARVASEAVAEKYIGEVVHARSRAARVLVAVSEPDAAGRLLHALGASCEVVVAESVERARDASTSGAWKLFLIAASLRDGSGLDLLPAIRADHPSTPLVVMMDGPVDASIERIRAHDAMLTRMPPHDGSLGASFVGLAQFAKPPLAELEGRLASLGLSLREVEVMLELSTGATATIAAVRLGISPATVRAHCARVYARLGVSNLLEVLSLANGWR